MGEPISLSALRGTGGVGDLLDRITQAFPPGSETKKKELEEGEELAEEAIEEKKVLDDELTEQIIEVAKKFKENR